MAQRVLAVLAAAFVMYFLITFTEPSEAPARRVARLTGWGLPALTAAAGIGVLSCARKGAKPSPGRG